MKVIGCVAFTFFTLAAAHAQDASGNWYWTIPGRNGGPDRTNTLTLKVDGTTVTGTVGSPGRGGAVNKTDISDGKITDGQLTFKTSRERNGTTTTMTYTGKVTADAIEGTIKTQRGDAEARSRTWKVKRQTSGS